LSEDAYAEKLFVAALVTTFLLNTEFVYDPVPHQFFWGVYTFFLSSDDDVEE
jgi:hypothetical protein